MESCACCVQECRDCAAVDVMSFPDCPEGAAYCSTVALETIWSFHKRKAMGSRVLVGIEAQMTNTEIIGNPALCVCC